MASEQRLQQDGGGGADGGERRHTLTSPTTAPARPTRSRSPTGRSRRWTCARSRSHEDDFGMMAYDPAFTNTASCRSAITYIDGEAGILQHRGIPIEQLCEKSTYLEVAFLLIYGELPTAARSSSAGSSTSPTTPSSTRTSRSSCEGFRYDAHPMGMLLAGVGALSTFYPDAKHIDDPEERYMAAIRLIAKIPTLAAFAYRHNLGLPYVYPGQRPHLLRELPLDDVQDRPSSSTSPTRGWRRRSTCSSSSTPTTSRTARPTPSARSAPRRSTPTRRSPPASPRSTARCTAAPTRRCCGCCAGSRRPRTSPTSSRASRTARRS